MAQRKKTDQTIHEKQVSISEARFRAFADHVEDAYYLHGTDGVVLDVNRRACEMLGYAREELIGMYPRDFDATDSDYLGSYIEPRLREDKEARFDTYHRRKDGSLFPVEVRLFPYKEAGRSLALGLVSDISSRKQTEETVIRLNRELRAITTCHHTLLRAKDEKDLLNEVCRIICDEAGYRLAWVAYNVHDETKSMIPMAVAGHDQGYIESIVTDKFTWSEESEHGRGAAGEAIRSGNIVYISDIDTDSRIAPWRARAKERAYKSAIALPLKDMKRQVFGVMMVYSDRKDGFNDDDIRLMDELTNDLAFGICVLRDRTERQRAEESLQELNRELRAISTCHQILLRADDEQALLEDICRIICEEAGYLMSWVGYVEKDSAKTIRPVSWAGYNKGFIKEAILTWSDDSPNGQGPSGTAVRTGHSVYSQDISIDPRMAPWRESALERGFHSSIAMPLVDADGQVFGVLSIYSAKTHAFSNVEIRLLEGLAEDMAFGINVLRVREERDNAEESLRKSEERYRTIFMNTPLGLFRSTIDGQYIEVNPALVEMLGYTSPEDMIREIHDIGSQVYADPEDRKNVLAIQQQTTGKIMQYINRYRRRDGSERVAKLFLKTVRDSEGNPKFFDGIVEDITDRLQAEEAQKHLEAQLIQAQKMESVGRLAGGVAHDFNNMLGAIMGYSDLALHQIDPEQRTHGYIREIRKAADRSANLTRQLLAFARKQNITPKVLDLNATVDGMLNMLRRLIDEEIHLIWQPGDMVWPVRMDPSQLDQILANLSVNARDAINGVGEITIRTKNVKMEELDHGDQSIPVPGDFVCLSVEDNGCGMSEETLNNVFEPFFTTKEQGKGTGLGLSTVYGIAKQNEGFVNVDSVLGFGTTFRVFLPRYIGSAKMVGDEASGEKLHQGKETILLVEDDSSILNIVQLMLKENGYNVLSALSPAEALGKATDYSEKGEVINLLITDMVMPEMNGRNLARSLKLVNPAILCIFMSGYSDNAVLSDKDKEGDMDFIQKPFSMPELLARVRATLDN